MIVCDYIDKNVEDFIKKDKSKRIILTYFKEPFDKFKGNKVVFIDDILDEEDYREVDIFVNRFMKVTKDVFSIYLKIGEYCLFNCLELNARINLSRMYKFKYAIDKILQGRNKTVINYFCFQTELLEWLKQDYKINNKNKYKSSYKYKIEKYLKNSCLANYIFEKVVIKLFKDYKNKFGNILWMGSRSSKSKLIIELTKDSKMFLLPQLSGGTFDFIKKKYKFDLLKLKNNERFNKKWNYLKKRYENGLNEIAFTTGISIKLLETILKIDKNVIKDLLLTLFILEDNKTIIDLLIVEQSEINRQSLAVDFFNKNKLHSIEILHGVPGSIEVVKTDKIAVHGLRDKSFFSEHGIEKSKIAITGCPRYDKIFNIKDKEKKYNFLLLILDWVNYLHSKNSHKIIYKQVIAMLRLIQHFQDERLVIKLHPGQFTKEVEYISHLYRNVIHAKNRVEVVKDVDTINLLKDAKIVYNFCSSVGVEALLMKKPLIILDYIYSHQRPINYEKYNGCLVAKNYEELLLATEEILKDVHGYLRENNENIEKTRRYFSGDLKGESYKNVTNLIREMLYK